MSYLNFVSILRGYKFYNLHGQVYNYELYYRRVDPYALLNGGTKYQKEIRH